MAKRKRASQFPRADLEPSEKKFYNKKEPYSKPASQEPLKRMNNPKEMMPMPLSGLGGQVPRGVGPGTQNNMSPDYMNQYEPYIPGQEVPPEAHQYLFDKQLPLQGLRDPNLPTGYDYNGGYSYKNPPPLPINQNPYPDSRVLNKKRPPFLVR